MKRTQVQTTVTDSTWTEFSDDFDLISWGVQSDSAVFIQEYGISGWGSSISVNSDNAFNYSTSCEKIRIMAQSGSATVDVSLIGISVFKSYGLDNTGELLSDTAKIGDGTNYTEIESDGSLKFEGEATIFEDVQQGLIKEGVNNPSAHIIRDYAEGTLDFEDSANINDYVIMDVQLPHATKLNSDIYPHLHWFQNQNNTPNWLVQYRWQINGGAKTTAWTNYVLDNHVFTYVSGTLCQISGGSGITTPVGSGLSDVIQFRVIRDVDNDSGEFSGVDAYVGDAAAVSFDIHVEKDTVGSRLQYTK